VIGCVGLVEEAPQSGAESIQFGLDSVEGIDESDGLFRLRPDIATDRRKFSNSWGFTARTLSEHVFEKQREVASGRLAAKIRMRRRPANS